MSTMNTTPLVTIAIPAYKTEFLSEAIESALRQTYSNIEVIVVDDCSPNGVKTVADRFHDDRMRYYCNEVNVGAEDPSRNWQRCLELARGEYICILCDDDVYAPENIETLVELAQKYPSCSAFRSGMIRINEKGKTRGYYALAPEHESVEEYLWHYHSRSNHQTISEWMMRTSTLKAIGGYVASPMAWASDCTTVYLLAEQGGVASSPKRQVSFRFSSVNISGQDFCFIKKKVLGWQYLCNTACAILNRSSHPDKELIRNVVEHDRKYRLRKLFKHASIIDLCSMMTEREKYGLSFHLFIIMMLRNPIWHIIAKRKEKRRRLR